MEGMSSSSSGRSQVRQSRALDVRSRSMTLTHGPTGLRVEGTIPAGSYSRKDMQLRSRLLQRRLFNELDSSWRAYCDFLVAQSQDDIRLQRRLRRWYAATARLEPLASSKALSIVNKAITNHAYFKLAAVDLEKLSPDPGATHALIEAFRDGRAPAWMVAHLLGCSGHDDGYLVAREILVSAPGGLAESYAGVALAKIRGGRALEDLVSLLTEAPSKVSREGAAYGLQQLGGLVAARAVAAAGRDGYIKPSVAGSVLAPLPSSGQLVLELLDSGLERGLLIATWITEFRETAPGLKLAPWTQQETRDVVCAFSGSLERHGENMSEARRRRLHRWIEQHAG